MSRMHRLVTALCCVLSLTIQVGIPGQETGLLGVLQRGPEPRRGLLFLPVNVIEHYFGRYLIRPPISTEEPAVPVTVYYTERSIAPFDSWVPADCQLRALRVVGDFDGNRVYYLAHDQPWYLFVEVPVDFGSTCEFIDVFARRFRYFLEVGDPEGVPPFPAILELP